MLPVLNGVHGGDWIAYDMVSPETGSRYLGMAVFLIDQTVYQTGLVWSEWSGLIRVSSGLDGLSDGLNHYLNLAQTV